MTISTSVNKVIAQGNGATTAFSFAFLLPAPANAVVTVTDSSGNQTVLSSTQYSLSGVGNPNGGTLNYPLIGSPLAVGSSISLQRVLPLQQLTSLINQAGYFPAVVEGALDQLEMQIQQIAASTGGNISLQFPAADPLTLNSILPAAAARANNLLSFDSLGNVMVVAAAAQSATALTADLLNTALSTKGAGQIGFNQALGYAAGTVGAVLAGFAVNSDPTKGDGQIGVQAPYINTLPMTQHEINNTEVSLLRFIPKTEHDAIRNGTSVLDLSTYVNNAFAAMNMIYVPRGIYKVSSQMLIAHRVNLRGDGMQLSRFISAVAAGTDAMLIKPTTGGAGDYTFYDFSGFSVEPSIAGNGKNGIHVVTDATTFFSNFDFSRLYIGDFSDYGLCLDNTPASANAFFRGTINRCWLQNGIKGISIGDTIQISENTITGTRLTTPGVNLSGLAGARQVVVYLNNISTQAGSVELFNMEQPQMLHNQCEHPGYIGNYTGGLSAQVYLGNVYAALLQGNTFAPGNVTYPAITPAATALLFDGTSIENKIYGNVIQQGLTYHVGFNSASCQWNSLAKNNSYGYPSTFSFFDNSGALPNFGVPKAIPLSNSWVAFDSFSTPTAEIIEGVLYVRGEIKSGTVTAGTIMGTLPLGMRHTTQTKYFTVTTYNGTTYQAGVVLVGTDGAIRAENIAAGFNTLVALDGISFRMD